MVMPNSVASEIPEVLFGTESRRGKGY